MQELDIQKRLKELNDAMSVCQKVKDMLTTDGWKSIGEPLIDKMIGDVVGRKMSNGRWDCGAINKARKDERREYYVGYKQALIDLHNRLYTYSDAIPRYEAERGKLVSGTTQRYTTPMFDTQYGKDVENG